MNREMVFDVCRPVNILNIFVTNAFEFSVDVFYLKNSFEYAHKYISLINDFSFIH